MVEEKEISIWQLENSKLSHWKVILVKLYLSWWYKRTCIRENHIQGKENKRKTGAFLLVLFFPVYTWWMMLVIHITFPVSLLHTPCYPILWPSSMLGAIYVYKVYKYTFSCGWCLAIYHLLYIVINEMCFGLCI